MKTSQSMHSISTHMSLPSELAHDHFLSSSNFSVSQSFSEVKCHNTSRYACIYCFHGMPGFRKRNGNRIYRNHESAGFFGSIRQVSRLLTLCMNSFINTNSHCSVPCLSEGPTKPVVKLKQNK